MRLKSWLAAAAGVVGGGMASAQAPYPTNFDVAPAGATAPGLAPPTAPARPAFCLPGETCAPHTYHDAPPLGGGGVADLFAETAAKRTPHTFWANAEYLLWWSRSMGVPELVTSVPAGQVGGAGVIGNRLFPDNRKVQFGAQNGFRATAGVQLTECYSLEGTFFQLEKETVNNTFTGSGLPGTDGLARPYFPADGAGPRVLYTALPGQYSGVVDVRTSTALYGLDASVGVDTFHLFSDHNRALYGFRYVDLAERITITDASTFANGRTNSVQDVFAARNQFYGGQVGLHSTFFGGQDWSFETVGKFAVGGVRQTVEVFGANVNTDPNGAADREARGLFAQPTNTGRFERDHFAVTLDLTLTLGYQITPRLRGTFGYGLFYLSSAVRPGAAIDRVVNDSTLRFVTAADRTPSLANRPVHDFARSATDYWAQGLNFGLSLGY